MFLVHSLGKSYEVLLKEMIFDLLGMEDTTFTDCIDTEMHDVATPHVGIDGVLTPVNLNVHRYRGLNCSTLSIP